MKDRIIIAAFAALCAMSSASAQTTSAQNTVDDDEDSHGSTLFTRHTFSISGSTTSGSGISYRAGINQDFYAKVSGLLYFNESSESYDNFFYYNVGGELQRNLYASRSTRFYLLAGANYIYDRNSVSRYIYTPEVGSSYEEDYRRIEKTIRGGIGAGFEVLGWKHLSFTIDGAYNLYNTDITYTGDVDPDLKPGYDRGGMLGGGISIGYAF